MQARIMIVDDDSDVRLLLEDAMRAAGFDCVGADCGHQALALLEDFAADVVITDLRMPGMHGLELLSLIKGRCAVIVMTGFAEDLTAEQVMALGARDFFQT
ncbi:MAG: Nitrogen regulation protein NR(I) [Deltaproteobacteria bacterium ADurb.Bin510]|nr:MAG: Nitrogen regulation protein NR(I) [Deltaproteobacteria bacterium ADurb.Bin510]